MSSYQNLIRFYHDCYALDNSNFGIQDVLSTSVTNRLVLKTNEFIQRCWPSVRVNFNFGEKLFKAMAIYKKEKELQCCFYFINFNISTPKGKKNVITPLYTFKPYLFRKNNNYFLGNDQAVLHLNPFAIRMLASISGISANILSEEIPCDFLSTTLKSELSIFFTKYFPDLNITHHLVDEPIQHLKHLKAIQKEKQINLIPGSIVGMFKKGRSSLGVLDELNTMSQSRRTSAPLNSILNDKSSKKPSLINRKIIVPVNLNQAQETILQIYPKYNHLIVSGPPGTGKTLSIGAIVCDAVIKGKSVLIATKNEEPLDVIERMLATKFDLSNIFLRGGSKANRTKISKKLKALKKEIKQRNFNTESISFLRNEIKYNQFKASIAKKKINKSVNLTYKISKLYDIAKESVFADIQMEFAKYRKKGLELNDLIEEKHQALDATNEFIFEYMRERIYYFLTKHAWSRWNAFDDTLKTLTTRNRTQRANRLAELDTGLLLKLFPIWGVTAGSVSNYLPLKKEMFDLVVIDEASKSDIPSSLPLLYRAKKAIVIGDPKQMRHISFLSKNSLNQLVEKYELKFAAKSKLNYRSNSILDLCIAGSNDQNQFVQLKEHYRSYPEMIQFSNSRFYNNSLKAFQLPKNIKSGLSLIAHKVKGIRGKNGVNKVEANEVFVFVKNTIIKQRGLGKNLTQSIGILSPFRAQADYLQKEIIKRFPKSEIERHQILVGTPYAFQGDEKDIMVISFALDNDNLRGSHYLESEGVFNVSITRARQRQVVYYSFNPKKLPDQSLLRNYIHYLKVNHHRVKKFVPNKPKNKTVNEVHKWLMSIPHTQVLYNHNLNVFLLDFLVIKGKRKIFIDLVGFEGETHPMLSEAKYDLLYRLNVEIFVLTYRSWKSEKKISKNDIWNFIHHGKTKRKT